MVRHWRSVACVGILASMVGVGTAGPARAPEKSEAIAAGYDEFHARVLEISRMRLDQPKNITRAQALLVAPSETALARGWVVSFAKIAAQSDKFTDGVRQAAKRAGGADQLIAELEANPSAALQFRGADTAQREVRAAVAEDSAAMGALTYRLSEVAYGRTSREADFALQAQSGAPLKGITGATSSPRGNLSQRATPLMSQVLALGAVMALAQETAKEQGAMSRLAANQENDQCLRWARLNLAQCLAAVKDGQERAYCLSQHGLDERAKCWSWLAQPAS